MLVDKKEVPLVLLVLEEGIWLVGKSDVDDEIDDEELVVLGLFDLVSRLTTGLSQMSS